MEILSPDLTSSAAFVIASGKQITLYAKGLTGTDTVVVEILELSSAPDFTGNPCCDLQKARIEVVRRTPLLCPNGTAVALTAAYPWGVLDSPQGITLGVRLVADPAALVSVELHQSAADSCMTCICDKPCVDTTWTASGETRCVGTNIEAKEVSNCGTVRWVVTGPQTWVDTGTTRCENNDVEKQQSNDCGTVRWVSTATVCGYCPSLRLLLCGGGEAGFGFHEMDPKDPAATVELASCAGDASTDSIWIYPSAGPGHTLRIDDYQSNLIGYAVNKSDCAGDCGCPKETVINIAPSLVSHTLSETGVLTSLLSDGRTVVSNPLPSC